MRHRRLSWMLASAVLMCAAGCERPLAGGEISHEIAKQFELSGRRSVDLAKAAPGPWEKVCIIGPYMDNTGVSATLGFEWDSRSKTSILTNDSISLLLFVRGNQVVEYVEHPRKHGDFSNLNTRCFAREKALFMQDQAPAAGWPGLIPKHDA